MLWRHKVMTFCHRPGLVDFTRVSDFTTGSFGKLLFKLKHGEEAVRASVGCLCRDHWPHLVLRSV